MNLQQPKCLKGSGRHTVVLNFRCDTRQTFPVTYFRELNEKWIEHTAVPLNDTADPWRIVRDLNELDTGTNC